MKLCSSCGITKPKSLFYSDKSKVDGVRSNCKECHNISVEKRNSRPEVASLNADNRAKWELENKERRKIYKSDWFKQDSATNPEKYKAKYSKYYSSNKGLVLAKVRRRQLAKANRTPMWLDKVSRAEIDTAYIWCASLRKIGVSVEVDHIIPLQGSTVSGLHVPENLQVIHANENKTKGNSYAE